MLFHLLAAGAELCREESIIIWFPWRLQPRVPIRQHRPMFFKLVELDNNSSSSSSAICHDVFVGSNNTPKLFTLPIQDSLAKESIHQMSWCFNKSSWHKDCNTRHWSSTKQSSEALENAARTPPSAITGPTLLPEVTETPEYKAYSVSSPQGSIDLLLGGFRVMRWHGESTVYSWDMSSLSSLYVIIQTLHVFITGIFWFPDHTFSWWMCQENHEIYLSSAVGESIPRNTLPGTSKMGSPENRAKKYVIPGI